MISIIHEMVQTKNKRGWKQIRQNNERDGGDAHGTEENIEQI